MEQANDTEIADAAADPPPADAAAESPPATSAPTPTPSVELSDADRDSLHVLPLTLGTG